MKKKIITMFVVVAMLVCAFATVAGAAPMTGTLHILKYSMEDADQAGESTGGLEVENGQLPAGAVPLPGVMFEVSEMTPPTGKNWGDPDVPFPKDGAEALAAEAAGTITLVPLKSGPDSGNRFTTDASGQITISDLNGYYLVRELEGGIEVKTPVNPFVVSVPMVDPQDNSTWLTDVYVYPKNEVAHVSKTVDGSGVSIGDGLNEWEIKTDVPSTIGLAAQSADSGKGYFYAEDHLDASFVYEDDTLVVAGDVTGPLEATADYTVDPPSDSNEHTLTVTITKAGMLKLAGDDTTHDEVLTIDFSTHMADDAAQNTTIVNNAMVFYSSDGDPDDPNTPTEPETKPFIFDGEIGFTKLAADETVTGGDGTTQKPLADASFQVATSETNAEVGTYITHRDGSKYVVQSDQNGLVEFKNLPMNPQFDPSGTFTGFAETSFWVVEVQSPTGYNMLDGPVEVVIDPTVFENEVDDQSNVIPNTVQLKSGESYANVELEIVDTPGNSRLVLPKTGGVGTLLFTIGGIALVGVAIVLLIVYRKKMKAGLK